MLIDMHAHLWQPNPTDQMMLDNKKDILYVCEAFGVDLVYVSSLGTVYPDEEEIRRLNDLTYGFMREEPSRIRGYCYLNPRHQNTVNELRRGVEEHGAAGVKLWVSTLCDDPLVYPIAEACIGYDIPILVHAFHKAVGQHPFESLGVHVAALARRYPEANIIMAHLGANCYRELRSVKDCRNVWADFSGSMFHNGDLAYAKDLLGADRLLFGSDMPGIGFHSSWGHLMSSQLTEEEREQIGWKNADTLFGRRSW